jgi:hypothetical protein
MSLSFKITIRRASIEPALFIASYAIPALIAPSPITAMTCRSCPFKSRPNAIPKPAEIEVELCAAPKGSYSLSTRRVNPDKPPPCRRLRMRSRRPVSILCG